jgi:hypothetical protein
MIANYRRHWHVYRTGPRANFIKVLTAPPSKEIRKIAAMFRFKVLIGSITIVVGSFLVTLSVLHLYDFLNNIVTH